ncbi:MAG: hypothetical protein AAGG02_17060 [Cyanobacteria bacterium P01_H01_bin.15]
MDADIRRKAVVKFDGVIEIRAPHLPEGKEVEVIVLTEPSGNLNSRLSQFIGAAQGCYGSPSEVDQFIQQDRESWDS